jgi:uncharacterized protein (TIGR02646 family)
VIKLKPRPAVPTTLTSEGVRNLAENLRNRVQAGEVLQSKDFDSSYWRADDVKSALSEMHSGKCCYCERKRDEKRETDVEHFRPKAFVSDDTSHPGYWWLAYDWYNYFHSCKKCNQGHKKNQFPLMDGSSRAYTHDNNLAGERPFLINPENENPEDFIGFEWQNAYGVYVKAVGLDPDGRGDRTIKITGINEGMIIEERASLVEVLKEIADTMIWALRQDNKGTIKSTAKIIKKESSAERQFAGFRRAFFRGFGLGQYVAHD